MDNEIYKQIVLSYVPYGVKVQYEGILNGNEKSAYRKEHDAQCKKIDAKGGSYSDYPYPEYNMPKDVVGLKLGLIKRVSFWKNYINLEIRIKSLGLKRFGLNVNSPNGFKLVLRPLSDIKKTIIHNGRKVCVADLLLAEFQFGRAEIQTEQTIKNRVKSKTLYYNDVKILCQYHIDFNGLIKKGLAVDINTLNLSTKN